MSLKNALANSGNSFKKLFQMLWGYSRSWLSFSFQHSIVYYLKFIFPAESLRVYVDGLLSLAYIPNRVVVDMPHIMANHATSTRKTIQSIEIKVTRKRIFLIHSMAGQLIQTNKILCEWQMIIIFTCIFYRFLNKSNRKTKLTLKLIHIQFLDSSVH